jgi:hypothetical protein
LVDVKGDEAGSKGPWTLATVKSEPKLDDMALVKCSRLSVQPVTAQEWALVCKMAGLNGVLDPTITTLSHPSPSRVEQGKLRAVRKVRDGIRRD